MCEFAIDHHRLPVEDGPYALFEVVRGGHLGGLILSLRFICENFFEECLRFIERMVFPEEKLIEIAVNRWQGWTDLDKCGNFLVVKKDYLRPRLESVVKRITVPTVA